MFTRILSIIRIQFILVFEARDCIGSHNWKVLELVQQDLGAQMMLSGLSLFPLLTASLWFGFILRLGSFYGVVSGSNRLMFFQLSRKKKSGGGGGGGGGAGILSFNISSRSPRIRSEWTNITHVLIPLSQSLRPGVGITGLATSGQEWGSALTSYLGREQGKGGSPQENEILLWGEGGQILGRQGKTTYLGQSIC